MPIFLPFEPVGGHVVWCLVPSPFIVGSLLKSKQNKMTRTKEHSKRSNTNKIKFIYQQIHKKGSITNILI